MGGGGAPNPPPAQTKFFRSPSTMWGPGTCLVHLAMLASLHYRITKMVNEVTYLKCSSKQFFFYF